MPDRLPLIERILRRCDRDEHGHLLWRGAWNTNGYGVISVDGRMVLVHRIMLAIATGDDGVGLDASHINDFNCPRNCCEPDHLLWKTHHANLIDVIKKHGRLGRAVAAKEATRPLRVDRR